MGGMQTHWFNVTESLICSSIESLAPDAIHAVRTIPDTTQNARSLSVDTMWRKLNCCWSNFLLNTHLSEEDHQKEFIIDTLFYFEGLVLAHISISRTERSRLNVRIMPSGIIFCSHAMECRVLLDGCPYRYVPSVFSGDETSFAALGTQEDANLCEQINIYFWPSDPVICK